ncbi:hypothetical protein EXIGLDRAFT_459295 [Exidia glandulosa HHB12029]|uniref:Uncharacterized protein n=1 Tax=Exidia glandulosa HHB12029 TaxID=1314781 RepID=A0A165PQE5_EXIGL|nr:hypothetical protein EXIGLDRAFT_459295 [Exidia glandulosa HHB12029]
MRTPSPSLTHPSHAPATHAPALLALPRPRLGAAATGRPRRCRRRGPWLVRASVYGLGPELLLETITRIIASLLAFSHEYTKAQTHNLYPHQAFLSRLVNVRARSGSPDRRADAAGQLAAGAYGTKVTSPDMAKYVRNRCRAESHRSYHCASSHHDISHHTGLQP